MANKKCNKCNTVKDITEFHKLSSSSDGHNYTCKICVNEKNKKASKVMGICAMCGENKNLRYKKSTVCQKCYSTKITKITHSPESKFNMGKKSAKNRGYTWDITLEDYKIITSKSCFYCNGPLPETGCGLDRMDNDKGYTIENVVPCCNLCNIIKGTTLTVSETIEAVKSIQEEKYENIRRVHESNIDISNRDIYVFEEITENSFKEFSKNLKFFENMNPFTNVTIHIMSNGGDWYSALGYYDLIKSSTLKTTAIGYGSVSSSASIIFLACDNKLLHKYSTILLHDGSESLEYKPKDAENVLKEVNRQSNIMYEIYAESTNKDFEFWKLNCGTEFYISAEEAVEYGFADKIIGYY